MNCCEPGAGCPEGGSIGGRDVCQIFRNEENLQHRELEADDRRFLRERELEDIELRRQADHRHEAEVVTEGYAVGITEGIVDAVAARVKKLCSNSELW